MTAIFNGFHVSASCSICSNMEQLESFHCGQCLAALNSRQEYELTIHAHSAMLKSVRCDARNAFCFTQVWMLSA